MFLYHSDQMSSSKVLCVRRLPIELFWTAIKQLEGHFHSQFKSYKESFSQDKMILENYTVLGPFVKTVKVWWRIQHLESIIG